LLYAQLRDGFDTGIRKYRLYKPPVTPALTKVRKIRQAIEYKIKHALPSRISGLSGCLLHRHVIESCHVEQALVGHLELVQDSLTESKTAHFSPFFTFFQLRSTGYAPSKTQKLTKNQPVFANGRES
jgi:hypothetical protein